MTAEMIHGDNESSFVSREMQTLLKDRNIQFTSSGSYNKKENGMVERVNQVILQQLQVFLHETSEKNKDWIELLPWISARYNMHWNRVIKSCPYFIVFGRLPRMGVDDIFKVNQLTLNEMKELELKSKLLRKQQMKDLKEKITGKMKEIVDVGDSVFWFRPKHSKFSDSDWNEIFIVIEAKGDKILKLADVENGSEHQVSRDDIRIII